MARSDADTDDAKLTRREKESTLAVMLALQPAGWPQQDGSPGFGFKNLLQELLMNLVGFTGDVFIETSLGASR